MSLTTYGTLCTEVYNITKPIGRDYPDISYYIKHLSKIGGKILEVMVGTGRLLIPLLEAGLQVEGVDVSPDMLASCRSHCAARGLSPVLYQTGVENLDLPGKYNAIVVSFGSFMLLEKRSAAITALQASCKISFLSQLNLTLIRYEKWKEGKLIATELQRLPLHWFGRDEFILCLEQNGYKDITLCANYIDDLQPSSHTDTMCFSAAICD